jgi:hypothetical protein
MMNLAMGAVWQVVAVRWKLPMPIQVMRQAGAAAAMA